MYNDALRVPYTVHVPVRTIIQPTNIESLVEVYCRAVSAYQYGDGNVSLSGFSLGGSKVEALMQESDIRSRLGQAISIAGGASPLDKKLRQKAEDTKGMKQE